MYRPMQVAIAVALLTLVAIGSANAEFKFRAQSLTGAVGLVSPEGGIGSTFFFAGRTDLGSFNRKLSLESGFHYWRKSYDLGPFASDELSLQDLAISAGTKYVIDRMDSGLEFYGRGGLGLHFASISGGGASVGSTDIGIYLGGGAQYPVAPKTLIGLDLTYNVTDIDHVLLGAQVTYLLGG